MLSLDLRLPWWPISLQFNQGQFDSSAGAHHLHSDSSPHAKVIKVLVSLQGTGV